MAAKSTQHAPEKHQSLMETEKGVGNLWVLTLLEPRKTCCDPNIMKKKDKGTGLVWTWDVGHGPEQRDRAGARSWCKEFKITGIKLKRQAVQCRRRSILEGRTGNWNLNSMDIYFHITCLTDEAKGKKEEKKRKSSLKKCAYRAGKDQRVWPCVGFCWLTAWSQSQT